MSGETKRCSHCKGEMPLSGFSQDAGKRDGKRAYCRHCQSIYSYHRQHRKDHLLQGLKFCSRCWTLQPLSHFEYDASGYAGRASRCRACEEQVKRERAEQRAETERLKRIELQRERVQRIPRADRRLHQFLA